MLTKAMEKIPLDQDHDPSGSFRTAELRRETETGPEGNSVNLKVL